MGNNNNNQMKCNLNILIQQQQNIKTIVFDKSFILQMDVNLESLKYFKFQNKYKHQSTNKWLLRGLSSSLKFINHNFNDFVFGIFN